MLEVLGADYIRTARAKGLSEHDTVYRHAQNSLGPVVTLAGLQFSAVVSGAVLVETVFVGQVWARWRCSQSSNVTRQPFLVFSSFLRLSSSLQFPDRSVLRLIDEIKGGWLMADEPNIAGNDFKAPCAQHPLMRWCRCSSATAPRWLPLSSLR